MVHYPDRALERIRCGDDIESGLNGVGAFTSAGVL